MAMILTRRAILAAGASSLLLATSSAQAQPGYPRKPIALVVTFAAGGGTDVLARIAAKYLSEELGHPVNVVNKPGGNSIPGAMSVMSAAPDGYTLLFDSPATSSLHSLVSDLPYKVEQRTWGPLLTTGPYIYAVSAKSEWKSLKDMAEAGRRDPASIEIGWMGGKSFTDTTMLKLLSVAGIDISKVKKVPFAGSGPAMVALAGGHINLSGGNIGAATALIASGDLRALAVSGDERVPALPDVPSSKEAGVFVPLTSWNALSGPAGMPAEVVKRLDEAVVKIVKRPDYIKDLAAVGNLPTYKAPSEMPAFVRDEAKLLREVAASVAAH
ncbi:Bug family tripartite tricarboxylate transporter substrate binding protein [Pseudorhodoplanes sp.]|uniref:Bug family tripartite tricarboxylate transporter substrate binding protein n=1 Tax=Pseudorhodoplanes sp. TaxID=1934341 RepID=UPI003D0F1414